MVDSGLSQGPGQGLAEGDARAEHDLRARGPMDSIWLG